MRETQAFYESILIETKSFIQQNFPNVIEFMEGALEEDLPLSLPEPSTLPVCTQLTDIKGAPLSHRLVQAIITANDTLKWQQSYGLEDNFDAHYLNNYGWFNLVSPDGAFLSDDVRISVGFWGAGIHYKNHWHEPEEIYLPIAGEAIFHSEGVVSRSVKPGDMVFHKSNQPHSMDMEPGPLLAIAVWCGKNLNRKPDISR